MELVPIGQDREKKRKKEKKEKKKKHKSISNTSDFPPRTFFFLVHPIWEQANTEDTDTQTFLIVSPSAPFVYLFIYISLYTAIQSVSRQPKTGVRLG